LKKTRRGTSEARNKKAAGILGLLGVAATGCFGAEDPCASLDSNATDPVASLILAGAADYDNNAILAAGDQGGYHMYFEGRSDGLCPDQVQVEMRLAIPDTEQIVAATPFARDLIPDDNSSWSSTGEPIPFQICPTTNLNVLDRDLRLTMTMRDRDGRSAFVEQTIQLHCPTNYPEIEQTCHFVCDTAPTL